MPHNHRHDHHNHEHSHNGMSNERRVFWAMLLTGSFMLAEVIGGLISGSLALLADAGHMLTDFASLLLAWFAFRLSRRPADPERTYGYYRFEILAAFINGITLFAIVAWIFYEAVRRFLEPVEILGGMMMVVEKVNAFLEGQWGVGHATIQVERKQMASKCAESKLE